MKTASLPPLRVEPSLRREVEHVLREGESLSAFIETAVREGVARRKHAADFLARGIAAGAAADGAGTWSGAPEVLARLEKRVAKARRRK